MYYTIAIDSTILQSLNDISSEQSKAAKYTAKQAAKILNYLASNPNAELRYWDSGMQLAIHPDAS